MAIQDTTELTLTPTQIEGPYYKIGSPHRASLIEPGITGTSLVLTGLVVNEHGQPIPRAVVDSCHSDDIGNYDMVDNLLRGHVFTSADGPYNLETIVPACYEP